MSNKNLLRTTFTTLLEAINPKNLLLEQCRYSDDTLSLQGESYDLGRFANVHLFGSGKAVIPMAQAMQTLLGKEIGEKLK